jgi:hypothetical protein
MQCPVTFLQIKLSADETIYNLKDSVTGAATASPTVLHAEAAAAPIAVVDATAVTVAL